MSMTYTSNANLIFYDYHIGFSLVKAYVQLYRLTVSYIPQLDVIDLISYQSNHKLIDLDIRNIYCFRFNIMKSIKNSSHSMFQVCGKSTYRYTTYILHYTFTLQIYYSYIWKYIILHIEEMVLSLRSFDNMFIKLEVLSMK